MLVVKSKDREDCERIWIRLSDMHRKCLNSEQYATAGIAIDVREELPQPIKLGMTRETKYIID